MIVHIYEGVGVTTNPSESLYFALQNTVSFNLRRKPLKAKGLCWESIFTTPSGIL